MQPGVEDIFTRAGKEQVNIYTLQLSVDSITTQRSSGEGTVPGAERERCEAVHALVYCTAARLEQHAVP